MAPLVRLLSDFRAGRIAHGALLLGTRPLVEHHKPAELIRTLEDEHRARPLPEKTFRDLLSLLTNAQQHQGDATQPKFVAQLRLRLRPVRGSTERQRLQDRYDLIELAGRGTLTAVYKAIDRRRLEAGHAISQIAVKVLDTREIDVAQAVTLLSRATEHLQQLTHPNIVRVFDFDRDGDVLFMTMEYVEGRPLSALLGSTEHLDRAKAMMIIEAVGSALEFAHGRGLPHGNLQPDKILLTTLGEPKLIGFGISRLAAAADAARVHDRRRHDASAYASPETLATQAPTVRGDVYSLACIAWEMLTGSHPFGGRTSALAREHRMKPQAAPRLSRHEERALRRALELDPARRTQSVRELLADLRAPRAVVRPRGIAIAVGGVAIAAAFLGYFLLGPS